MTSSRPEIPASPRVAVVTGAGSGIGRATALRLLADGWAVQIGDVNAGAAQGTLDAAAARGPIFGDYAGIPPLLVLAGSIETLRDDGARVVAAAQKAGVDAEFVEGEGMAHIWAIFADRLPEARESIEEIGQFIRKHVG